MCHPSRWGLLRSHQSSKCIHHISSILQQNFFSLSACDLEFVDLQKQKSFRTTKGLEENKEVCAPYNEIDIFLLERSQRRILWGSLGGFVQYTAWAERFLHHAFGIRESVQVLKAYT